MTDHAIDAPTADELGLEHPHARAVAQELTTIADVGVRREQAARALGARHAEAWYVATILATAAASWALLAIARALTAATKETP